MRLKPALPYFLILCFATPAAAQVSALTEQLVDSCAVLTGKTPSDVFRKALAELRNDAREKTGNLKLYAQLANNRFACFEEELTGNAGWSVTVESKTGNGVSESKSPLAAGIENNPNALDALKESVSALRLIADSAPDYGLLAARQMLKYLVFYRGELPETYALASRAAAVYCNYKRPQGSRQEWGSLCRNAGKIKNEMLPRIEKTTRDEIDAQSQQWARTYASNAKIQPQ